MAQVVILLSGPGPGLSEIRQQTEAAFGGGADVEILMGRTAADVKREISTYEHGVRPRLMLQYLLPTHPRGVAGMNAWMGGFMRTAEREVGLRTLSEKPNVTVVASEGVDAGSVYLRAQWEAAYIRDVTALVEAFDTAFAETPWP
jgi:hypothetical protein